MDKKELSKTAKQAGFTDMTPGMIRVQNIFGKSERFTPNKKGQLAQLLINSVDPNPKTQKTGCSLREAKTVLDNITRTETSTEELLGWVERFLSKGNRGLRLKDTVRPAAPESIKGQLKKSAAETFIEQNEANETLTTEDLDTRDTEKLKALIKQYYTIEDEPENTSTKTYPQKEPTNAK